MLTYNTAPKLTLIDSPKIVEGKIMLTVGDSFTEEEKNLMWLRLMRKMKI